MRERLGTVLLGQLCAEGVNGDDESAAVCFKLWGAREERMGGGSSQLPGLPHARPRAPAGGWEARYSPPRMGHMAWGSGPTQQCRTCRRIPGRPVQGMRLNQPRQGDSGVGLPGFPLTVPFFPPQLLSWLIQVSYPWTGQGSPMSRPPNSHRFSLCISQAKSSLLPPHPAAREQFLTHCLPRGAVPLIPSSHEGIGLQRGPCLAPASASLSPKSPLSLRKSHVDGLVKHGDS